MHVNNRVKKKLAKTAIAQVVVSMVYMPFAANFAYAQSSTSTTTCSSSSYNCVDLYQGTLNAINAYAPNGGYQPASDSTNQSIKGIWNINQLNGGVLNGGNAMVTVPDGQGVPVETVLSSTFVFSCPGNTAPFTGSVELQSTISDTVSISSSQTVTNTSTTFNSGNASVTIGFTEMMNEANVGSESASQSTTLAYSWGQTYSNSTATTEGVTNSTDTASTLTYNAEFSVEPGYGQYIQLTNSVTSYSQDSWSANIVLESPTSNPITSQIYWEYFASANPYGPVPQYESSISGNNIPANIWYAPNTWYSTKGDALVSPNGIYAFIPNWTAQLIGFAWVGSNNAEITYDQGAWYNTSGQGMNLQFSDSCTGNCAGSFWATNSAGNTVAWDSNTSPSFIAMQNDGNLVGYSGTPSSATAIWSSKTTGNSVNPVVESYVTNPSTLLPGGQAFTASGVYSSTTYASDAYIGSTTATPLTSDQLAQYCPTGKSTGAAPQQVSSNEVYMDGNDLLGINSKSDQMVNEWGAGGKFLRVDYQSDSRREAQRLEDARLNNQNNQAAPLQNRGGPVRENQVGGPRFADSIDPKKQRKPLGKLRKLADNFILKRDEYYAAKSPGLRVIKVTVKSRNHTNYNGFDAVETPKGVSFAPDSVNKVRLKKGLEKNFTVEPGSTGAR